MTAIDEGLSQFRDRPMLLLWGEKDWCFTIDSRRGFQQRFPQAESHVIADAGHYVFEDAAEDVAETVRGFLDRTSVR